MSRYIDADKANDFIKRSDAIDTMRRFNGYFDDDTITRFEIALTNHIQAADVRENIIAHKVIGGGEHDGATCWFECSRCGKTVDVNDKYCSECGARFEA